MSDLLNWLTDNANRQGVASINSGEITPTSPAGQAILAQSQIRNQREMDQPVPTPDNRPFAYRAGQGVTNAASAALSAAPTVAQAVAGGPLTWGGQLFSALAVPPAVRALAQPTREFVAGVTGAPVPAPPADAGPATAASAPTKGDVLASAPKMVHTTVERGGGYPAALSYNSFAPVGVAPQQQSMADRIQSSPLALAMLGVLPQMSQFQQAQGQQNFIGLIKQMHDQERAAAGNDPKLLAAANNNLYTRMSGLYGHYGMLPMMAGQGVY